jgi:uroporphyrinogen decarboxylase
MSLSSRELFFKACSGESNMQRPPVWFMRQAGRYLPEYQAVRKKVKFLDLCRNPELAAEVSLQPVEIIGVDAAIIFSDILLPLADFGIEVDFPEAGGIKVNLPEGKTLGNFQIGSNIQATCAAIKVLKHNLKAKNFEVPVLGFAGAPWTLANYILEGGSSKAGEFKKAKQLAWTEPARMHELLDSLADMTILYLNAQIEAGAEVVQLFDTWAGELSSQDFAEFAAPYLKKILAGVNSSVPKILFVKGVNPYLTQVASLGADVLSVDWKISLTEAWQRLEQTSGNTIKCLQGNLDPALLTVSAEITSAATKKIIEEGRQLTCGHILNLGHGVTPDAKVESAKAFVNAGKPNGYN